MTVVLDTSVLAAVIFGETDAEDLLATMQASVGDLVVGAATLVEATIVVEARQGPEAGDDLQTLLRHLAVEVVAVDDVHAHLAMQAWRRFGKGRHPAQLTYGDCLAYALTKANGGSLLFKGQDFAQTDVAAAR